MRGGDKIKYLASERIRECLSTPNWSDLPSSITSIEIKEIGNGVLSMRVKEGNKISEYFTIRIIKNM